MEWIEICTIINRGRPIKGSGLLSTAAAVLSPLSVNSVNCEIMLEAVKHDMPIIPTTCPMAGSTSPYAPDGTLVQGIAESLIIICTAQVMNPGNPCLFSFGPSVTEMNTGRDLYYTIDKVLLKIAAIQFAKRLGLPTVAETGGAMNCRCDMQSGAEGMLMALSAAVSGADVLAGAGSCLNANGLSPEFIVMQHAFVETAQFLHNGFDISGIEKSLNSIREQNCGGNFLTDGLTIDNLYDNDFFKNPLFDMAGEIGGGVSMFERANDAARKINENFVSPVPEDIAQNLRMFFELIYKK